MVEESIWSFKKAFAFLEPFEDTTWLVILGAMMCVGLVERYIEGHFASARLLNPKAVILRLRNATRRRMPRPWPKPTAASPLS